MAMNRLLPLCAIAFWSLLGSPFATAQEEGEVPRSDRRLALLRLRIETWELAALDAARWVDEAKGSTGLADLRAGFLSGQRPARLVASPTLSLEEDGDRSAESITEWIYPTEYEGGELPEPAKPPPTSAEEAFVRNWRNSIIGKFICPDSFEVRDTGDSLQAKVRRIGPVPGDWDLSLSFDMVQTPGELHFGIDGSPIKMPLFNAYRGRGSRMVLKESRWRLFSLMEAPRGLDGRPVPRRWLTLVRIDPEP